MSGSDRNRDQGGYRRRNSRSRSRERSMHHYRNTGSDDKDLYRDLINDDYKEERSSNYNSSRGNYHRREENYDNERDRDRDRERDRDRDQRWKNYDREPRERNTDYDRGTERK